MFSLIVESIIKEAAIGNEDNQPVMRVIKPGPMIPQAYVGLSEYIWEEKVLIKKILKGLSDYEKKVMKNMWIEDSNLVAPYRQTTIVNMKDLTLGQIREHVKKYVAACHPEKYKHDGQIFDMTKNRWFPNHSFMVIASKGLMQDLDRHFNDLNGRLGIPKDAFKIIRNRSIKRDYEILIRATDAATMKKYMGYVKEVTEARVKYKAGVAQLEKERAERRAARQAKAEV